jgi:predicted amidohydrolase YtcJ
VSVEGNRISGVDEKAAAGAAALHIDLGGRLVVPGFIDNHVHFIAGCLQLSRVDLRDATSTDDLARRIAQHAVSLPRDQWVLGGEWDEQRWSPAALPTRAQLDAIEHPVFVTRMDMHMALANTRALQLAGIDRHTPDPAGGTIVRDAHGEPTGVVKDTAMALVHRVIPTPTVEERVEAARKGLALAASKGVTSFCDMGMRPDAFEDFRAYQRLDREGALTARVHLYTPINLYERVRDTGVEKRFGSERLRIGGLKGFSDGSLGSSTAAFFEPYEDDCTHCGLVMGEMSDGSMATRIRDANAHEMQLAIHAIGDRANADVLSIFESIDGHRERRFRVEHAQHLNPELIQRFANGRFIASMQPAHAIDDGRWAEKKIGAERAKYTYAIRSLLDAGAIVTFGSDWTVAPLDPLHTIYAAVTRRTMDGKHPEGWIPEQRITVEEALRCHTVNNAWATFSENETGRIAPGLLADMVVLSDDLFTIDDIRDAQVDMTIFDGRVIYERA